MFLVDTNIISELRKSKAGIANTGVTDWADDVPAALMFMSVISLRISLNMACCSPSEPTQPWARCCVTGSTTVSCPHSSTGSFRSTSRWCCVVVASHVPDPAPFRDALIGATGLVHGLTVVTRDVGDFARFDGLPVLNPWT